MINVILAFALEFAFANDNNAQTKYSDISLQQRCSTKSQEKKVGAVRDQGDTSWCFAHSAADLLTHEMGLGPRKQVSALWVGALYDGTSMTEFDRLLARNWTRRGSVVPDDEYTAAFKVRQAMAVRNQENKSRLQDSTGGFVENSLEIALGQDKMCLVSDLAKYENSVVDPSATLTVIEHRLAKQKKKKQDECQPRGDQSAESNRNDLVNVAFSLVEEQKDFLKSRCSEKMRKKKVYSVKEAFYRGPDEEMEPEEREEALATINEVLDRNKIFAMAYQSRVITAKDSGPHALHSSSVIGRKMMNGKCFYQVRNSWGPDCSPYKKDESVHCEHGGSIYVEESALLDNMMGIQYLD